MTTATQELSTTIIDRGVLPTTEVIARVHRIQEVMAKLMKKDVHFGTIPGTPKPTLYKPGAELLLMTFRIAASPAHIEDLSTADEVRYRVTVRGANQLTGEIVGEMVGECSSSETKYRWIKPVCDQEWEETDPAMRREKWFKGYGDKPPYKAKQIRSSPADVANTILKMATKRALIAMTLVALGASDIFAQDLEDLTEELRDSIVTADAPKPEAKQPQRKSANSGTPAPKTLPADAKIVTGVIAKVWPASEGKPHAIQLKNDQRRFTTFDEAVAKDAALFENSSHQIKLAYVEVVKQGRTYTNAVGVSIADAEPVKTTAAEPPPLTDADIFGERNPGEEG